MILSSLLWIDLISVHWRMWVCRYAAMSLCGPNSSTWAGKENLTLGLSDEAAQLLPVQNSNRAAGHFDQFLLRQVAEHT